MSSLLATLMLAPLGVAGAALNRVRPEQAFDRDWLLSSYLEGSELGNKTVFGIAFEPPRAAASITRLWLAASDGLYSFDGFQWRRFGTSNGLPSNFVRCVRVTHDGQLWVGTDHGSGTFDGRSFQRHGSERGLAGQNVRRIIEDWDGTLWFCSDSWPQATGSGGISSYRAGRWQAWGARDGLPSEYVVNYLQNSAGRRFAATAAGLAELRGNRWVQLVPQAVEPGANWGSASIAEAPGVGTVVSTGTQVLVLKGGVWHAYRNTLRHEHGIAATRDGKIVACGSRGPNRKAFVEWTGRDWRPASAEFEVTHDYVEQVEEAPDGSLFAVGFDCFERWQRNGSEWAAYPRLPRPVWVDRQDRVWAMDERGLFLRSGPGWQRLDRPYKQVVGSPGGDVWAWDAGALVRWRDNRSTRFSPAMVGVARFSSVETDAQGKLWVIGPGRQGRLRAGVLDGAEWSVRDLPARDWVVGSPDPVHGLWLLSHAADGSPVLLFIDKQVESFPVPPNFVSRYINALHADQEGAIWLMGETGLHVWRRGRAPAWNAVSALPDSGIVGCLERAGELWFVMDRALGGKSGLASFAGGRWRTFETEAILQWAKGSGGELLFASKGRFYVVPPGAGSEPSAVRLPDNEPVVSLIEDRAGSFWLGTSQALLHFCPDRTAPRTALVSFNQRVLQGEQLRVRAQGLKRFAPPGERSDFFYSWRMDAGPWSPFDAHGERSFSTVHLATGEHHLQVRARDNELNLDPHPPVLLFQVHDLPLQERRWFIPLTVGLGILLVSLTAATGSAHYKLAKQARNLEQMVEQRTGELRVREEEMRQANRVLQRANEDLRQFAWAASHDLQEPLRMVIAYTQFLARRYQDRLDETGQQFIQFAVTGAQRMETLLLALLEYWQVSERSVNHTEPVDTAAALDKALSYLEPAILESGAVVSRSLMPCLAVSETALTQVFQNLIGNAIKYRRTDERPRIDVAASYSGSGEWLFSVRDNGIGIAPEYQEIIFGLFKRLEGNQQSGAGIGLAICAKVIEQLHGRLWVESQVGQGATFYFTIPDAQENIGTATRA